MTAASTGKSTGEIHHDIELKLAIATDVAMVNLIGGLPVIVDGQVSAGLGWDRVPANRTARSRTQRRRCLPGQRFFEVQLQPTF
jgi:hypothetical protein